MIEIASDVFSTYLGGVITWLLFVTPNEDGLSRHPRSIARVALRAVFWPVVLGIALVKP